MNQHLLPVLCITGDNKQLNADPLKRRILLFPKNSFLFLISMIFLMLSYGVKAQETLVGITSNGGAQGKGTVFSIKTNATLFTIIKALPDWGRTPFGDLLKGDDGNFYGTTSVGGTFNYGTIFKATPAGVVTVLHQFDYAPDGANPVGELI